MKRLSLLLSVLILISCSGEEQNSEDVSPIAGAITKEQRLKDISALEEKLFTNKDHYDEGAAHAIVREYTEFVEAYSNDLKAPEYLFRAGEVSSSLKRSIESVKFFQQLERDYPEYEKIPDAIFMQGYVFETQLEDMDRAREEYQRFVDTYPNHVLAEQTKLILTQLGKSPEELIEEFEAKQQES